MKALIFDYRFVIAVILAAVIYALLDWQNAKQKIYQLMLLAKSQAKDAVLKSGKEQEEWVIKNAYKYLPKRITILIPEQTMRKIVKILYKAAKDYLDDGKLNNSQE